MKKLNSNDIRGALVGAVFAAGITTAAASVDYEATKGENVPSEVASCVINCAAFAGMWSGPETDVREVAIRKLGCPAQWRMYLTGKDTAAERNVPKGAVIWKDRCGE